MASGGKADHSNLHWEHFCKSPAQNYVHMAVETYNDYDDGDDYAEGGDDGAEPD